MLSFPPLPPPHPLLSPALLAFLNHKKSDHEIIVNKLSCYLARPSGLLGNAGLDSLGKVRSKSMIDSCDCGHVEAVDSNT